ncbi:MAG: arsenosugar biosynthesis arsenite methyltransferase ArsM [Planctomycetota bacterium]
MSYHDAIQDVYRKAAEAPASNLCCVPNTPRFLPGLHIPSIMHEMNYGCGTTVHLEDMAHEQRVVYVGVGGGLEALQLAYFTRHVGGVIAVDPIPEMREAARKNLEMAAKTNDWFDPAYVDIRDGNALALPLDDASADLAAQNCLFNIFKTAEEGGDLEQALAEMHRVLAPAGRLVMSDPISPVEMPTHLRNDDVLRAECISGSLTYDEYMAKIVEAGFGAAEIRSRRPYRMLDRARYNVDEDILLESIEVAAYKVEVPDDGACIFTGRSVIYTGSEPSFDDGNGHLMQSDLPLPVCDKTAGALESLERDDLTVTPSTWHYAGGGCC